MRFRRLAHRHLIDLIAVVLAVVAQIEAWVVDFDAPRPLVSLLALTWTLPLLARRRFPFAAPAVVVISIAATSFIADRLAPDGFTPLLSALIAAGLFGAHERPREVLAGSAIVAASIGVVVLNEPSGARVQDLLFVWSLAAVAVVAGVAINQGALRARELEERALLLEGQREKQARAAVADERARIARELHDVVAHNVSVMVVQAGAGERDARRRPRARRGRRSPRSQQTGREALGELRRMLGALRDGRREAGPRAAAGLADSAGWPSRCARPACRSTCAMEGEPRSVPAGVDLSAYRIVQEAPHQHAQARRPGAARRCGCATATTTSGCEIERRRPRRARPPATAPATAWSACASGSHCSAATLEAGPRPDGGFARARPAATARRIARIRVLIADDQALVRAGFRMILERRSRTSRWSARPPTATRPSS